MVGLKSSSETHLLGGLNLFFFFVFSLFSLFFLIVIYSTYYCRRAGNIFALIHLSSAIANWVHSPFPPLPPILSTIISSHSLPHNYTPPISHSLLFSYLRSFFLWSTNKILHSPHLSNPRPNFLPCSTPNSPQIWSNSAPDLAVSASPSLFRSLLRWLLDCVVGAHRSVCRGLRFLARLGQFVVNSREFW